LILGAGLWELAHPPVNPVVLFHLHANAWWGAVMFALGILYSLKFSPKRAS